MELVADANVLLSAAIGGRAGLIVRHPDVKAVFTPSVAMDEVYEYLGPLARKKPERLVAACRWPAPAINCALT